MTGNFLNLTNLHIQEAKQTPNRKNSNKSIPRYFISSFLITKDSEKHLESSQKKCISYRGTI